METTNLELQSVKELRNIAKDNGIDLPTSRVKKEEIIAIISDALKVEEVEAEVVETAKWFESKVTARSLKKLSKEALLEYPPFMGNEATYELESADTLKTLVLAHIAETKKVNDPARIEKKANFEEVKGMIFLLTDMGTEKLTKEQVANIRSNMQGKSFSKQHRSEIKDMINDNRRKMFDKFVINEDYGSQELRNATLVGDIVIHDEGEMSQYEALVMIGLRDFGEGLAFSIKKLIDGEVSEINTLEKQDRYVEMSYDILLNEAIPTETKELVVSEIERIFDLENYPVDYNQLNIDSSIEAGSEIYLKDNIGKKQNCRVVQTQPLIVQPWGQYFMGDCAHVDNRYFSFDSVNLTKEECFAKHTTPKYMADKYKADEDPAITPNLMTEEV